MGGTGGPLWLNEDGSEASSTDEVTFGPPRFALSREGRSGKLFAAAAILVLAIVAIGFAARHHPGTHPAAARTAATPGSSPASSFVASDTAPVSGGPVSGGPVSTVRTSIYAPGHVPASAVLIDDGASSGGAGPDGTVEWAEELHNVSYDSLTLADAVQVHLPSTLPARIVTAEITVNANDMSHVPPPIQIIEPGQIVSVLVSLHLDCRKINNSNSVQELAPVTATVRLIGYAGTATFSLNHPAPGGPSMLQEACPLS